MKFRITHTIIFITEHDIETEGGNLPARLSSAVSQGYDAGHYALERVAEIADVYGGKDAKIEVIL